MSDSFYDVVIVGAGPAGIQAAIHAARRKTRTLLLGRIENSALYSAHVENYACVDGVKGGRELLETGLAQAVRFGAKHLREDLLKISQQEDGFFAVETESGSRLLCRTLILAMGTAKTKLGVPGESEFSGRGVSYCVDCDANFFRNATVLVVGNHSAAADGALTLLDYASKVYLAVTELKVSDELLRRLTESKVELLAGRKVKEICGNEAGVQEVVLDSGETVKTAGVFIELGAKGALQLAAQIGVQMDMELFKYIDVNRRQETNIPGVYAAGDITGPPYQMAKAVGEGCVAGMEAAQFARKQRQV
ncbi:MAG: NAD(P)/FAD-dependent oxidoreductase [Candidatus Electronema sp. V4]|uniref:NAD(P)/FAD-dependent oxidoreductase n=1 Tax=Candidatus Electronema sp. V4 TaxID=3454756 RepID=UPI004055726B